MSNIDKKTQLAHEIAKEEFGSANAKEFMDKTNEMINSKSDVVRNKGLKLAGDFTSKLALLILYQDIEGGISNSRYEWRKFFNDEVIAHGNSKQFTKTLYTGNTTFSETEFNPTQPTYPQIETKTFNMYTADNQGNKTLSANAYQFKKPLTIQESMWLPYFMSGKLGEFVEKISQQMRDSYDLFVIQLLQNKIKALQFAKTINDTTNNDMFSSFVNSINPSLEKIQFYNTEYNIDAQSKNIDAPKKDDLVLFINSNNLSKLRTGVNSRLYNAKMFDLSSVINENNIIGTSGAITVGNENTAISVGADWLDENTIIVLEKDALRHCLQLDRNSSQAYAANLTIQIYLHVWGLVDFLPWKKGFKYTNNNLSVIPN